MIGIYYRVSTEDQTLDMQMLQVQKWLVKNAPNEKYQIYQDIGISGASTKRPGFNKMIQDVESKRIGTVVVYRLDRLTRTSATAIKLILRFDEIGCAFVSVSQDMFSRGTPFRLAILAIFAELAQMEREIIVERVRHGLEAAKKRGVRLGAPIKATDEKIAQITDLRASGVSQKAISLRVGLSVGLVNKIIKSSEVEDETR